MKHISAFQTVIQDDPDADHDKVKELVDSIKEVASVTKQCQTDSNELLANIQGFREAYRELPETNDIQHKAKDGFLATNGQLKALAKQIDLLYKQSIRSIDIAEKELGAKSYDEWDTREINRIKKELDGRRKDTIGQLKTPGYYFKQIEWLQSRFPDAELVDVEGLVKQVDQSELKENDWSLTPGRYVGVAPPEEDEDFDFEATLSDIHIELDGLNKEAAELAEVIRKNFEGLGI